MLLADVLHRGIVITLAGITGWGLYTGASVHFHTLEAGKRALAEREAQGLVSDTLKEREEALAEQAAQSVKPTSS
ncbi:hypothetical protein DL93DRAFT_507924 [Clavulina sp. PMI_390]|nr:hypothetical protein DL93DRAFT_507924 [Clavulina sp. PMI_390]